MPQVDGAFVVSFSVLGFHVLDVDTDPTLYCLWGVLQPMSPTLC